jgi:hypothetical protein
VPRARPDLAYSPVPFINGLQDSKGEFALATLDHQVLVASFAEFADSFGKLGCVESLVFFDFGGRNVLLIWFFLDQFVAVTRKEGVFLYIFDDLGQDLFADEGKILGCDV